MPHSIRLRAGWIRHLGPHQTTLGLPDAPPEERRGASEAPLARDAGAAWDEGVAWDAGMAWDEGVVRYQRPFNCPTGLESGEGRIPVDLVIESWSGLLTAELDGKPLAGPLPPTAAPLRVAVSDRLSGHHQLEIELAPLESGSPHCRLTGLVTLEIHD